MAGIYIHYPFCKSRCYYCDFYTVTHRSLNDPYMHALFYEMESRKGFLGKQPVETIYFGGGTPSLMHTDTLQQILDKIYNLFEVIDSPEITLEVNPDDITNFYTNKLVQTDINRISLGIQAFYNYHLQLMNRRHKVYRALKSVEILQKHNFDNISIDLIYGLPEMTMAEWQKTLQKAVNMNIQHISAYHLSYEEGTVFDKLKKSGMLIPPNEEDSFRQFEMMVDFFEKHDFIQYEISNFGRLGRFSKHNISYWQNKPYLGLGPSAHSFDGKNRFWNVTDISKYIRIEKKQDDILQKEPLSQNDKINEYLMTGLRTYKGIDSQYIQDTFNNNLAKHINTHITPFIDSGHVKQDGSRFYLSKKGMFISDRIISELFVG